MQCCENCINWQAQVKDKTFGKCCRQIETQPGYRVVWAVERACKQFEDKIKPASVL